ncbi:MAG: hypothetical protein F6K62_17865 [Sphaerospermopsis sp. SIO1G2]|nr:hypothetical protein [Sphaerospermopsis sp. SIO1G2]
MKQINQSVECQETMTIINPQLAVCLDCCEELKWHKQLLDMAIENTTVFDEQHYDRVGILLDLLASVIPANLEELETNLKRLI